MRTGPVVFSSIDFLFLFLPLFLLATLPAGRFANPVLLAFSLLFYFAGEGVYLLVMLASIGLNTVVGRQIDGSDGPVRRRWLALGVGTNLAILGWFKYTHFAVTEVAGLDGAWSADIHLPLGISFFTFQAISYLVDIHRGACRAERSALHVGTYIAMFPQLIAGPIVRFASVAEALHGRTVDLRHLYHAFGFFALGLASKVLLADTVAEVADGIWGEPTVRLRADAAAIAILAYTQQIYFDFLGYSLMAVGLGFLLGFRFPRNFNHPYVSASVTEFWRRWHISLSTWFRDYLYIPLGGNRHGAVRTYLNLWIVFLATGLWHGAAWTFVLWGIFHGGLLVVERLGLGRILARLPTPLAIGYTLAMVMVGWVLFRSESLGEATGMLSALGRMQAPVPAAQYLTNEAILTLCLGLVFAGPWMARAAARVIEMPAFGDWPERLPRRRAASGLALFALLTALSLLKILAGSYSPFIYFRF